jgi:hypothetical protein
MSGGVSADAVALCDGASFAIDFGLCLWRFGLDTVWAGTQEGTTVFAAGGG